MRHTFADLVRLAERNPEAYRAEIQRLSVEDPERLDGYAAWFVTELGKVSIKRRHASLLALIKGATTTRAQE
jgi:hypothetical protein